METDLRSRVVHLEHKMAAGEGRLSVIEQWRAGLDVFNARRDEQFENLKGRFDSLDKNLTDRFLSLDKKIDTVNNDIAGDLGAVNANLTSDYKKVEDTLNWLGRLIIGTIITGSLAGFIGLMFKMSTL